MTITIKSTILGTPLVLDHTGSDSHMSVRLGGGPTVSSVQGGFYRADFLAAVETECGVRIVPADAIVIEHDAWPEVMETPGGGMRTADGRQVWCRMSAEDHRAQALRDLAAAEYMDAHPRVDEAQVAALSEILHDATDFLDHPSADDLAVTVIATGRVTVTP